jgi:uncharacterized protein
VASPPLHRILWQRLDMPGLEWCEIRRGPDGTQVDGVTLVATAGMAHRIEYAIEIDSAGRTRRAVIRPIRMANGPLELRSDEDGHWIQNGAAVPRLAGCLDVDLGFSPMTNSLPIWRLGLAPGETREVRAAWVRFPEFTVEALRQTYERTAASTYVYRSDDFEAQLRVDADGIVEDYPSYWRAVAHQSPEAVR